jgi:hypothetical protein
LCNKKLITSDSIQWSQASSSANEGRWLSFRQSCMLSTAHKQNRSAVWAR